MHDVSINGKHRAVPDSWNALTREQLLKVVRLLYSPQRTPMDLRFHLLCVVLGIRLPYLLTFTDVQIAQLLPLVQFVLDGSELTAQLLPAISLPRLKDPKRHRYYGPRESFRNLRLAEFIFADSYFLRYAQEPAPELLDKLVAVLYRPQRADYRPHAEDYGGDRRADFNEHLLDARARTLSGLPLDVKLAVLTWYRGCRSLLSELYPHVFQPATQAQASGKGWDYVLRELSGKAFGSLAETSRQHALLVLAKMEDDLEAAERLREEQRNHQPR